MQNEACAHRWSVSRSARADLHVDHQRVVVTVSAHLVGRPVSRATYEHLNCRCEGCTAAVREHRVKANAARTRDHAVQLRIEKLFMRGASYTEVMAITGESYVKIKRLRDRSA